MLKVARHRLKAIGSRLKRPVHRSWDHWLPTRNSLTLPTKALSRLVMKNMRFLRAWENVVPIFIISGFIAWGLLAWFGPVRFPAVEDARVDSIYKDVGIGATAGIFAIVVSLSLLAIQSASQEYGHRIMTLYIKSIMFWSTILVYLGLIIATILLVATLVEPPDPTSVGSPDPTFSRNATVIVIGSILALTLLIPHFFITASYLRPEFIIGKLLRRVDDNYLQEVIKKLAEKQQEEGSDFIPVLESDDRLLPVVEILIRSFDRDDLATTRIAMGQLEKTYHDSQELLLDWYFLYKVERLGAKALSANIDDEAARIAVRLIGKIGLHGPAADRAVENIRELGVASHKRDAELVVRQTIRSLREIFVGNSDPKAKEAVLAAYRDLAAAFTASRNAKFLDSLVDNLCGLAHEVLWPRQASMEERQRDGSSQHGWSAPFEGERRVYWGFRCLELLGPIGEDCATSQVKGVVLHLARNLHELGVAAATELPDDQAGELTDDTANCVITAQRVIDILLRIERAVGRQDREVIATTDFVKGEIERALERTQAI